MATRLPLARSIWPLVTRMLGLPLEAARFTQVLPGPLSEAIELARAGANAGIDRDQLDC
jgi:hypothetical protein